MMGAPRTNLLGNVDAINICVKFYIHTKRVGFKRAVFWRQKGFLDMVNMF